MKKILGKSKYVLVIFLISTATFILIQTGKKNYFVNDDTLSYFLPNIVIQAKTLFNSHSIPFINFYQFLGHPLLPQGQSGVLYLPHYFFYLFSLPFKNYELIVSFEVYFHIIVGSISMFYLLKKLKISNSVALITSYAYGYNGFIIEVGRNWFITSAYLAYAPLLILFLLRAVEHREWNRYLWLSIMRTVLFYIGYTNFFAILVFFELILFLLLEKKHAAKQTWLFYFYSHLITAVLSLPILLPIINGLLKSVRLTGAPDYFLNDINFVYFIKSFFSFPHPVHFTNELYPSAYYFHPLSFPFLLLVFLSSAKLIKFIKSAFLKILPIFFYILFIKILINGGLFYRPELIENLVIILLESIFILMLLYVGKKQHQNLKLNFVFVFLLCLSLIMALGQKSLISTLTYPIFYLFRWPFKWYLATQIFLTLVLALMIDRLVPKKNNQRNILLILLAVFCFGSSIYVSKSGTKDWIPMYDSYLSIKPDYIRHINNRTIPVGLNDYNKDNHFSKHLTANIASYFDLLSYGGYDPLTSKNKSSFIGLNKRFSITSNAFYHENKSKLKAYGVRSYLYDKNSLTAFTFFQDKNFEKKYQDKDTIVYEDVSVDPIVFLKQKKQPLKFQIRGNKIRIKIPDNISKDEIVIGFYKDDDNWIGKMDNKTIKIQKDEFNRLVIPVEKGAKSLEIVYVDQQFILGLTITSVLILIYLLVFITNNTKYDSKK